MIGIGEAGVVLTKKLRFDNGYPTGYGGGKPPVGNASLFTPPRGTTKYTERHFAQSVFFTRRKNSLIAAPGGPWNRTPAAFNREGTPGRGPGDLPENLAYFQPEASAHRRDVGPGSPRHQTAAHSLPSKTIDDVSRVAAGPLIVVVAAIHSGSSCGR